MTTEGRQHKILDSRKSRDSIRLAALGHVGSNGQRILELDAHDLQGALDAKVDSGEETLHVNGLIGYLGSHYNGRWRVIHE
ncbi:hypothetical protein KXD40_003459 [Peronospora effusa]|uniref:Uncharacterized protein n=1 Tax=Peronospora effusa TaxID=542832 RepID=A0A3M6VBI6_9STRA|nr:hypothetical protein DD238_007774 [Peronospora effusa]UIZ23047.1 hypothetical protein KXD40_003459 [Peronospora effusa]